ncbi:TIGR04283 family arsenosugar biosynthesis glycosyltransferase [Robiginitalea sp. IMCC43444]|uniref:TIGR04283 family arsenosugar biosynthesis glycosyltransferase n=1 Tax=Robiginitalea sp. IMCC43444 TaxID=3459121 RepID=UPI0040424554
MISVIIPAHNESENLRKLIPRLKGLQEEEIETEILVSLSAKTNDGSQQLIRNFGLEPLRDAFSSRASQMNLGASRAKGDILCFLHADVWPPEGFFSDMVNTLQAGNQAGFFSYRFDRATFFLKINGRFTRKDGIFTGGGDQCLFISKEVFEDLGGFDTKQLIMEDFEIFERIKKRRLAYHIVPNDLVVSARKYRKNSYLRVNLSNLMLLILFRCGCSAPRLRRIHNFLIR